MGNYACSQKNENNNWSYDYALMWSYVEINDGEFWVSLRSNNKRIDAPDVTIIAKQFSPSGGGHKNASGFSCTNLYDIIDIKQSLQI